MKTFSKIEQYQSLLTALLLLLLQPWLFSFAEKIWLEQISVSLALGLLALGVGGDLFAGFIYAAKEKASEFNVRKAGFVLFRVLTILHSLLVGGLVIFLATKTVPSQWQMLTLILSVVIGCILLMEGHRTIARAIPWNPPQTMNALAQILMTFTTIFFSSLLLALLFDPAEPRAPLEHLPWIIIFCLLVFVPLEEQRLRQEFYLMTGWKKYGLFLLSLLIAAASAALPFFM